MNEPRDQFNPADFWPDAEKMLDRHFRRKRIVKLSIITACVSAMLVLIAFWAVNVPRSNDVKTDNTDRKFELNTIGAPSAEKTADTKNSGVETTLKNSTQGYSAAMIEQVENTDNNRADQVMKGQNNKALVTVPSEKLNRSENVEANLKLARKINTRKPEIQQSNHIENSAQSPVAVDLKAESNAYVVDAPISELPNSKDGKKEKMPTEESDISGLNVLKPLNLLANPMPEIGYTNVPEYRVENKKRSPQSWNIGANLGLMRNFANHQGGNESYRMRRADEEKAAYTFTQGLGVRRIMGNWSVYGGMERSTYGENTNYNNIVDGEIPNIQSTVSFNYDSTIVNRNIYYLGNEFQETVLIVNTDSLFTYDTLFNSASVVGNLPDGYSGSRNRYTYFEIPVSMAHSVLKSRRLSIDGFAGISIGILQQARGSMLNGNNTAFLDLQARETLNNYLLNYRGGLSLHYAFINGISVSLAAEYRGMARSIHTVQSGLNSRYQNVGILVGLSYSISKQP